MNRRELVRAVSAQTAADPKQVEAVVGGMVDVITAVVAKGDPVSIPGFVKFSKVHRAARIGRNPQTGEPVQIQAKTVAKATAMKAFKDQVMAPSKAPRLDRGVWPTNPDLLTRQAGERKALAQPKKAAAKKSAKAGVAKKRSTTKAGGKRASTKKAPARKTKSTARKTGARKATKKAAKRGRR